MPLSGEMLIGASRVRGGQDAFRGVNATTGEELDPLYGGAGGAELERACALAWSAFDAYRAYFEYVPKGSYRIDYVIRLNQSGHFQLPATRVEALYEPAMFGESPNAAVDIQP